MKTNKLKYPALIVLSFFVSYLMAAFINVNLDVSEWEQNHRVGVVFIGMFFAWIVVGISHIKNDS